ncbi:hypothetical protein TIFTF001_020759 [Ficus carica]|uniref:Uncharacterized protein n=1 Tax=Ficus carica TaxID=3494 RepID=A0AA88AYA9_FICCA|nr:hypothetical protein TIFTF001_020759 [Ficus carica]
MPHTKAILVCWFNIQPSSSSHAKGLRRESTKAAFNICDGKTAAEVGNAPRMKRLASKSVKLQNPYTSEFGSADLTKRKRTTKEKKKKN